MVDPHVQQELLALERQGWDSLCEGSGDVFYGELMTADGVMVLAHGEVLDRDAVVASLAHAPTWSRYALSDVRCVAVDDDSAALVYRGTAARDTAEPPFDALMASVYVRVGGAWQLALHQQTTVPA